LTNDSRVIKRSSEGRGFADRWAKIVLDVQKASWARNRIFGLFIHQMAGFDVVKAKELYSIPQRYEPVAAIAIGYPGLRETLPEQYQQRQFSLRSA